MIRLFLFYLFPAFVGFRFGGIFGALLLVALGYVLSRVIYNQPLLPTLNINQIRTAFYNSSFAIMGYIAKSDGRVSEVEIRQTEALFVQLRLTEEQKQVAMENFRRGRSDGFVLKDELDHFKTHCSRPSVLINLFLEMQVMIACVDGLCQEEEVALKEIFTYFARNQQELERLIAQYSQAQNTQSTNTNSMSLKEAYETLGVSENDNIATIKKAYRKQMTQYHPDKLVSKGLPKEMIKVAEQKAKNITKAYEHIKKHRTP